MRKELQRRLNEQLNVLTPNLKLSHHRTMVSGPVPAYWASSLHHSVVKSLKSSSEL
jgi:hypothetical protein